MAKNSKMSLKEALDKTAHRIKEIHITEGEVAEDCGAVVCATVEEVPITHCKSAIELCSECENRIWVSRSSPKTPPRICYHCYVTAVQTLDDGEKFVVGISNTTANKIFTKGKLS